MSYGFVYLARNASMPGLYKIGATRRHPELRMEELSSATGVPSKFEISAYMESKDCFSSERDFHSDYSFCRENEAREFFRLSLVELHDLFIFFMNTGISYWIDPIELYFCELEVMGLNENTKVFSNVSGEC